MTTCGRIVRAGIVASAAQTTHTIWKQHILTRRKVRCAQRAQAMSTSDKLVTEVPHIFAFCMFTCFRKHSNAHKVMHTNIVCLCRLIWWVQMHTCLHERPGPASATRTHDVPGSAKRTDQSNSSEPKQLQSQCLCHQVWFNAGSSKQKE